MKYRFHLLGLVCLLSMFPVSVLAVNSVLSGTFDGSEPKTVQLPGTCGESEPLGYIETGAFQVSVTGSYTVTDVYNSIGVDVSALIYLNSFNPNAPSNNLITPDGVDLVEIVNLNAGIDYVLVVQHWCGNPPRVWVNFQGAWTVSFSGPGAVTANEKVVVPEWTEGSFTSTDPISNSECGNSQYQQTGPVQVSTTGTYYYSDVSIGFSVDLCLQIYSAPFDPANPNNNRIFFGDDSGSVDLEAGTDYYFVTQPLQTAFNGEFFYVFAPSEFYITYAISGSWFYPPTNGQGFLIDVFDQANIMFLAWFTYDLERPADGAEAMIGDPGHRWMTAAGPIVGNTANLDITWSSGMIFDSEAPPVTTESDGTMKVEFDDCKTGRVIYDLGSSGRKGTVPIERIVNDAVSMCETLTEGPTNPGPL
jgi:hypothetical protein